MEMSQVCVDEHTQRMETFDKTGGYAAAAAAAAATTTTATTTTTTTN